MWEGPPPQPAGDLFVDEVYPLLLRDCAFVACHGGPARFLQVFGPGRVRLDPAKVRSDDPMRLDEVRHSYDRARTMLTTDAELRESLFLSKPLALEAGGQGHEGLDDFGQNLFASVRDPGYELLLRWAESEGSPPSRADVERALDAIESAVEDIQEGAP